MLLKFIHPAFHHLHVSRFLIGTDPDVNWGIDSEVWNQAKAWRSDKYLFWNLNNELESVFTIRNLGLKGKQGFIAGGSTSSLTVPTVLTVH